MVTVRWLINGLSYGSLMDQYLIQCSMIVNWNIWNTFQWHLYSKKEGFFQKCARKIRCNMSAILFRPHCGSDFCLAPSWWRHQMETFSALLTICAGNSSVPGEFPAQRPVTRSFDVFLDLRLNKRLSKQSWGWWFETLSRLLWGHCNGFIAYMYRDDCRNGWT